MVRLDYKGAYQVKWPRSDADILALGQAYIAHETSLPAAERVAAPSLAEVELAYTAVHNAHTTAHSGEITRAVAAGTYRQTMTIARSNLEIAIIQLKARHFTNLAQLEQWGLDTVANGRGVTVRKPRTDNGWAALLAAYVRKESSLPPADQISNPSLAEMTAVLDNLQTAHAARTAGRNQREANVQARLTQVQRLLDLLQTAAIVLVATRYNGVVTNALQTWGYQVIAARPRGNTEQ
ncbi:MAG TPA: hypothetical protein PLD25_08100 [Chloroflexota bacterium]|nr:hypothetical protein [Chloroflexota bacterium]HUM68118.1 hypothetical protein [Chloroflexota bacterium]